MIPREQNSTLPEAAMEIDTWQLIRDGGSLTFLALALFGIYKRWWVPGWLYRSEQERADRWEQLAWSLTNAAQKAVDVLAHSRDDKPGSQP